MSDNQKMFEIKTLMNVAGKTEAYAPTYVDLAPSGSVAKRDMKLVIASQILTAGTFDIAVTECATTNGTFTAVAGDTIVAPTATQAAVAVAEYAIQPKYRYIKAAITTVTGASAAGNFIVLVQNLKRQA